MVTTRLCSDERGLDWHNIDDVDELYDELAAQFESGDIHAAYLLSQLIRKCGAAPVFMSAIQNDPNFLQRMDDRHVISSSIAEPCLNRRLGDEGYIESAHDRWFGEAATSGHPAAALEIAFKGMGSATLAPRQFQIESDADFLALRQTYVGELSQSCYAPGLALIGDHLPRGFPVTEALPRLGAGGDDSGDMGRPLEGFAYRYAAAYIEGSGRPESAARSADYPLTAAKERDALRMGRALVSGCR